MKDCKAGALGSRHSSLGCQAAAGWCRNSTVLTQAGSWLRAGPSMLFPLSFPVGIALVVGTLLGILKDELGYIFTNDE